MMQISSTNIILPLNGNVKKPLAIWQPHTNNVEGTKVNSPEATIDRVMDAWEHIAYINLSNTTTGLRYRHVKFNYASTSKMMYFWLNGYSYNYQNTDVKMGLYMYTGTSILNKHINNSGGLVTFINAYKAADGKLVLVIDLGATTYTSAAAQLYVKGHNDELTPNNIQIESICSTASTGAQY